MASPRNKEELSAYLTILYHCLEREQVEEPQTIAEFRQEIRKIKEQCVRCDVEVPTFDASMIQFFSG